jgi:hypothetical protein
MKLYKFCGFVYEVFSICIKSWVLVECLWFGKFSKGSNGELVGVLAHSLPAETIRAVELRKTK